MGVNKQAIEYSEGGETLEGVLFQHSGLKPGEKRAAVLVIHAFQGISDFEEEQAEAVAKHGYIAFCVDVYGKGKRGGKDFAEAFALMKPFQEDRAGLLRRRLLAALEKVKSLEHVDSGRIGAMGFCFGGMCALDMARINCGIKAAVSFHGGLSPLPDQLTPEQLEPIAASVLVCHGDADTHITVDKCLAMMEELRARRADWQFISYGNAKHGFTEPKLANSTREGIGYNEKAAKRSFGTAIAFFAETL